MRDCVTYQMLFAVSENPQWQKYCNCTKIRTEATRLQCVEMHFVEADQNLGRDKAQLEISVPSRLTPAFFPSSYCKKLFIFDDAVYLRRSDVVLKQGTFPPRAATAAESKNKRVLSNWKHAVLRWAPV